ncbi:MAG: peptidyl-alpha-hydroxyglycine alpha-amidating lyase family protein [Gammaproteobacteria bacterium]|nr:peptidyl-alpha-hydroxyglycine alpha-amidating lyase family protein [Gammaproteobacteria bacterium]MDP2140561.1 peptidyl-alpha-hydroxyglycine alpha-amidating lyase family protein [Gammaproteobacteria bacterium]MDP2347330.1 peptidyl-alpha-hydroxyglycine alpha-amidating lyase family protein [Gammaproteobacteria bacterium]
MKTTSLICLLLFLLPSLAEAQRPIRPLLPLRAYTLQDYRPVDFREALELPANMEAASYAAVAMTPQGNLIVLSRSAPPFLEFDSDGKFVRSFGADDLLTRAHGMTIEPNGNMWVTDVTDHVVMKLDRNANILMTLGTKGEAGEWSTATPLFNEPNDVALDSRGNIYVAQGHGGNMPRVLKFSPDGRFITQWGSRGYGPGQFVAAHAIEIDADDVLYVADRENMRIQRFDTEGTLLREWKFDAMVCAIFLHEDGFMYITTGFDGEFAKVDMEGNVLGSIGSPGTENGQFGEAHALAMDAHGNAYIADVILRRVQKFAKE